MISLSVENSEKAGVSGGDEALENEPAAKTFLDTLSYSNKRKHVLAVEGAKKSGDAAASHREVPRGLPGG